MLGGPGWPAQTIWPVEPSPFIKGLGADTRTDLGRVSPPGHVLGSHGLLDAVHLLLVALAVPHGVLLGLLQRALQRLHALGRGSQALLQLGQLTAQVCIVPDQLQGRERWGVAESGGRSSRPSAAG